MGTTSPLTHGSALERPKSHAFGMGRGMTHPAAMLDKNNAPSLSTAHASSNPIVEQLFAALDAEAEEEKE